MAIGISISGEFLALYPNTVIDIIEEEDFTSNKKVVKRPKSMPFKIPTAANRYLLDNPHLPESYNGFKYLENVYVYIGSGQSIGVTKYVGQLYILRSNARDTECSFVSNEHLIKDLRFSEVEMGSHDYGVTAVTMDDTWLDNNNPVGDAAKDTAVNPQNYDHVVTPIYNPIINDGAEQIAFDNDPARYYYKWQNFYNPRLAGFYPWQVDPNAGGWTLQAYPFSPFLKVQYVLSKIGAALGYGIEDHAVTAFPELASLYLYNNADLSIKMSTIDASPALSFPSVTVWPSVIDYNQLVPGDNTVTQFISDYADNFFCGVFVDNVERRIDIIPYVNIIDQGYAFDFTDALEGEIEVNNPDDIPDVIEYERDGGDGVNNDEVKLIDYSTATDYFNNGTPLVVPSLNYDVGINQYLEVESSTVKYYLPLFFRKISNDSATKPKVKKISSSPLHQGRHEAPEVVTGEGDVTMETPVCQIMSRKGGEPHLTNRFFFYRGMKTTPDGDTYPYANNSAYDIATRTEGYTNSLLLQRDTGVYEIFGKRWVEFIRTAKAVQFSLKLTIGDLSRLKPWHKIRVGRNHYLIKEKRISINSDGISSVRVTALVVN